MQTKQSIQLFFTRYVTFPDRVILTLLLIGASITATLNALNYFYWQLPASNWGYELPLLGVGAVMIFFIAWGMYVKDISPRGSTALWGCGFYFWSFLITTAMTQSVQATPFSPIDAQLVKADAWFGVDLPMLMAWTHAHPFLHHWLTKIYYSMVTELLLIPIILICLNARRTLSIFFIAILTSFFVGALIYYFFPTMAPSGIFHSPYFTKAQYHTSDAFFQVHHHLKITASDGGLVAFPSFHVIWASILTYCCRIKKYFFYPALIFNTLLILATLLLGWHYLMDVLTGIALAMIAIYIAETILK